MKTKFNIGNRVICVDNSALYGKEPDKFSDSYYTIHGAGWKLGRIFTIDSVSVDKHGWGLNIYWEQGFSGVFEGSLRLVDLDLEDINMDMLLKKAEVVVK